MEMPRMQYLTVSEKGIHASPAADSSFTGAGKSISVNMTLYFHVDICNIGKQTMWRPKGRWTFDHETETVSATHSAC